LSEASQRLRACSELRAAKSRVVKLLNVIQVVGVGELWLDDTAACSLGIEKEGNNLEREMTLILKSRAKRWRMQKPDDEMCLTS
jgi:hypothetical protein